MDEFNPLDFDFYHMGVSGGKDSTATLLWLIYESGWPTDRIMVTFCDTDNEDTLTYNYLAMLSERVYPIETIQHELGFYELARKKNRFPAPKSRFCTITLKVIPSMQYIEELKKGGEVLTLSGIRRAEGAGSNKRGDLEQFHYSDSFGTYNYLPLYEYDLNSVWELHKKHLDLKDVFTLIDLDPTMSDEIKLKIKARMLNHGIPRNPLYDMGAGRVGCYPCIMSRKGEIRYIPEYRPERIEFLSEMENSFSKSRNKFSSFFARRIVPERFRSKEIETADGEKMNVPTIHDVVDWSKTAWGAKQYEMFLEEDGDPIICDFRGLCE